MRATTSSRGGLLYWSSAAAVCTVLYLVYHIAFPAPVIDPHPSSAPWHYLLKDKSPRRHIWLPGKGRCEKTLRISLDARNGLGSSLMLLVIPGLTMARHYGYTPLIDDKEFNYGRLTDYLEPMQLDCEPGDDWDSIPRVSYQSDGWLDADHIYMDRDSVVEWYDVQVDGGTRKEHKILVDDFWRNEYMLRGQSKAVLGVDSKALKGAYQTMPYLPSEMSFSQAVRPSFRAAYQTANEFFALNSVVRDELEKLVSQTRPHRREGVPVLGAIIRLGDKASEKENNPGANAFANWAGYAETLREQAAILTAARHSTAKPILVIMSDDAPMATEGMKTVLGEDEFDIRAIDDAVPVLPYAQSDDRNQPSDSEGVAERRRGHDQDEFNHQPDLERIASARSLVRDLYYMSKHTDSLVVSSTSNVGRIALLLAGEEQAYGDLGSDAEPFRSIGGLSRSIDTRWFPCVYYAGCFQDEPVAV